jgi:hypothetical protein
MEAQEKPLVEQDEKQLIKTIKQKLKQIRLIEKFSYPNATPPVEKRSVAAGLVAAFFFMVCAVDLENLASLSTGQFSIAALIIYVIVSKATWWFSLRQGISETNSDEVVRLLSIYQPVCPEAYRAFQERAKKNKFVDQCDLLGFLGGEINKMNVLLEERFPKDDWSKTLNTLSRFTERKLP